MSRQVLVFEDDAEQAELISRVLGQLGYSVKVTADAGPPEFRHASVDLFIVDIDLPTIDGIEYCRKLRQGGVHRPVVLLASVASEDDALLGLEIGADDYLVKPVATSELRARVKAVMRRFDQSHSISADDEFVVGSLTIDPSRRRVKVSGSAVDLTAKEFDLLSHFIRHRGHVYTRGQLLDAVWGRESHRYEHTVDSHINRLRAKIEQDPAHPQFLLTVWGLGYKFNDELDA